MHADNLWPYGSIDGSTGTSVDPNDAWSYLVPHTGRETATILDCGHCLGTIRGNPVLWPIRIASRVNGSSVLGQFRKLYAIGWGTRSGLDDVVSVSGTDYLLMTSSNYAGYRSMYAALELV